jgi:membrane associated rhomboid family serine protease
MRTGTSTEKFSYWLYRDGIPVTKLLVLVNALTFLLMFLRVRWLEALAFDPASALQAPWTFFTFGLLGTGGPINLLFQGYWLWIAGGSLERAWGSRGYALFFFAMCGVTAAGMLAGGMFAGSAPALAGLWLPVAGVTIAFAMMNPEQQILFFFLIPLKLKYLALLDVALVFVAYGRMSPILGLFALCGCGVSYWYVRFGRNLGAAPRPERRQRVEVVHVYRRERFLRKLNPLWWLKESRERKRLRDLFGGPDSEERR